MAKRVQTQADQPGISPAQRTAEPTSPESALAEGDRSSLLQETLDNLTQGISVFDSSLRLVAWNNRFMELLELPEGFVELHKPFSEFVRYAAERNEYGPGDVEAMIEEKVNLAKRLEPYSLERTRPDDTVIEVTSNPLPGGGFTISYADISESKRAEFLLTNVNEQLNNALSNFQMAIDSMSGGFAAWSPSDKLVFCNDQFKKFLPCDKTFSSTRNRI
jgi:PAS domain-containing protein